MEVHVMQDRVFNAIWQDWFSQLGFKGVNDGSE